MCVHRGDAHRYILHLIFRLRFSSSLTPPLHVNSRTIHVPFRFTLKLRRMSRSRRDIGTVSTAVIAISISHVRACLCKAWHLQDMKINGTPENCTRNNFVFSRSLAITRYQGDLHDISKHTRTRDRRILPSHSRR